MHPDEEPVSWMLWILFWIAVLVIVVTLWGDPLLT